MEWTTERRYRRYEDWTEEEKQAVSNNMATSPWHTHYHVEPKSGLLNDPNGFSYFDGKWILFYQNFPFGAAHGLKSWVQTESEDLVHFKETGVTLSKVNTTLSLGAKTLRRKDSFVFTRLSITTTPTGLKSVTWILQMTGQLI